MERLDQVGEGQPRKVRLQRSVDSDLDGCNASEFLHTTIIWKSACCQVDKDKIAVKPQPACESHNTADNTLHAIASGLKQEEELAEVGVGVFSWG